MRTIIKGTVIGFRHGDKDGALLSPFGCAQVNASAEEYLAGRNIVAVYASEMARAFNSAQIITATLRLGHTITQDSRFGFSGFEGPELPQFDEMAIRARIAQRTATPTVYHLLTIEGVPNVWAMRFRAQAAMFEAVQQHFTVYRGDAEPCIVIASHTPVVEAMCKDPREVPLLGTGDLMLYEVMLDIETGEVTIIGEQYLACPLKK